MKRLAVFLGNPTRQYAQTRHNAGWMVLDRLEELAGPFSRRTKFNSTTTVLPCPDGGEPAVLLQPTVFMNNSGLSIAAAARFYSADPEHIWIVHDDLELPFGTVAEKHGGGFGGHNGLRSAAASLGTGEFHRIRVGIGRPPRGDAASFVLSRFSPQESAELSEIVDRAARLLLRRLCGDGDTRLSS
jgi:peptidyl-tRNA hydrolase, PTH1 family